ncbi:alpha/beta hydrolase [Guggenheimella bovis]
MGEILIKKKPFTFLKILFGLVFIVAFILMPILAVYVYRSNFETRFETPSWEKRDVSEYPGLLVKRSDFNVYDEKNADVPKEEVILAGYEYSRDTSEKKGVVVLAHGLGGGGHISYLSFIDYFTKAGYNVFTYDARGNDQSGGKSMRGIPEGIVDLDYAIRHVESLPEYEGLPIVLFGHSWGGYSVGSVLNLRPEVKAVVSVAGFNQSRDLLGHQGAQMLGASVDPILPYFEFYEWYLFGKRFRGLTAIGGFNHTDAGILIVHSKDDTTVPPEYGYDLYYRDFKHDPRFQFILYEDLGHDRLLYSESARAYRAELDEEYQRFLKEKGVESSNELKKEFMDSKLDKVKANEPNDELFSQIVAFFDRYTKR